MLTWVEVNLANIKNNILEYKKYLNTFNSQAKIMGVVKSNAYGHGISAVAQYLDKENLVDILAVVSDDEALFLLEEKIQKRIFILSFWSYDEKKIVKLLKSKQIIFPVYYKEQIEYLNKLAYKLNLEAEIFLKVDTGTRRVGIEVNEVLEYLDYIKTLSNIKLLGLYSHFASSEDNYEYTLYQLNLFTNLQKKIKNENLEYHFACSAATLVLAEQASFNYIRLGLASYGLWPDPSLKAHYAHRINLKPALIWKSKLIHIKKIPKGAYVGYGNTYKTKRDTILGVMPVGYWDGYDRKLSNKGEVIIKGKKVPVLGRVCMNLTMIDLSDLENPSYTDEVILLGEGQSADEIAQKINTINYEIVTRINPKITRIYIEK